MTLSGTITGGSSPLADTTIRVYGNATSEALATQITTGDGTYSFSLDAGTYRLEIDAPTNSDYGSVIVSDIVLDDNTIRNIALLAGSNTLSGTLKLPDGRAVAGAEVSVYRQDAPWPSGTRLGEVETDTNGSFSFELTADTYMLRISVLGRQIEGDSGTYQDARAVQNLDLSSDLVEDIVLPYVTVSGQTTDSNGVPVAGAGIELGFEFLTTGGYYGDLSVISDESGDYSFITPAYNYDVLITSPANSVGLANTIYENVGLTSDTDRDFILEDSNTLSGTLKLPDGRAVAGAEVSVYRQDAPWPSGTKVGEVETDTTGGYSFELTADTYMLRISVLGRQIEGDSGTYQDARAVQNLDLSSDLVEDIVLPYVTVSGQTTDSNGVPVAGAGIELGFEFLTTGGYYGDLSVISDESGDYSFITPAYNYDVLITSPANSVGLANTIYENVGLTSDTDRDFILEDSNTLSGTLKLPDGRAVAGAEVSVYRQDAPWPSGTRLGEVETDTNGSFSFELTADTYMLRISVLGRQIEGDSGTYQDARAVQNLDLSSDLVEDIVLPYVTVSGQTTDSNGVPVAGAGIELGFEFLTTGGYYGDLSVISDENGDYSFITPAYNYDVLITPPANSGFAIASLDSVDVTRTLTQDVVLVFNDVTPPRIIGGPLVNSVDSTSAVVEWETDEATTGEVTIDSIVVSSAKPQRHHSIVVAGLEADTSYSASVSVYDTSGNGPIQKSSEEFRTLAIPDVTSPILVEGPIVTAITRDKATVKWETDEPATTELSYALSGLSQNLSVEGFRTVHEIEIAELDTNTQYSVRISTTDDQGNGPTVSESVDFRTKVLPDITAPIIVAGPLLSNVTDSEATIVWTTDEPSVSALTLIDGEQYKIYSDETLSVDHEIRLTGLLPETAFEFTVSATDAFGNGPTLSSKGKFSTQATPDTTAPVLTSAISVFAITHHTAQVRWQQDEPVSGIVEYGLSATTLVSSVSKANLNTNKVVHLSDLLKDTQYYFRIRSFDSVGNEWISDIDSFRTRDKKDTQAPKFEVDPVVISASSNAATFEWSSNEPTSAVFEYESDAGVTRINESALKNKHLVTLSGLESDQQYPFTVTLSDKQGNQKKYGINTVNTILNDDSGSGVASSGQTISDGAGNDGAGADFSTTNEDDITAPVFVSEPSVVSASSDKVLLQWSTDEPSTAEISFGESGSAADRVLASLEYQTQHTLVLSNLEPEKQYTLNLTATDVSRNTSEATLDDITSLAQTELTTLEFASVPLVADVQGNQISLNWQADDYAIASAECKRTDDDASWSSSAESWEISGVLIVSGLEASTEYECSVQIVDLAGTEANSEVVVARTIGTGADSDSDGLQDIDEQSIGTDPLVADTDADGVDDSFDEFPLDAEENRDTDGDGQGDNADTDDDGDGLPDAYEIANGLSPLDPADADADTDNDGWSNIIEFAQGTSLAQDDNPPELIGPARVITESTGALTEVDTGSAMAIDAKDGVVAVAVDKTGPFEPGRHILTWSAVDAAENYSEVQQIVDVIPTVSFAPSQKTGESGKALVDVILNGYAVDYPVTIGFDVSGDAIENEDYEFVSAERTLVIEEGLRASIEVDILSDSDFQNETIEITFTDIQNAAKGSQDSHQIVIQENNLPPAVSVNVEQGGRAVTRVTTTGGLVTVSASIADPNPDDMHLLNWISSDAELLSPVSNEENSWSFDPSALSAQLYRIGLEVTDNGESPLPTLINYAIKVKLEEQTLSVDLDTDGDGLNDAFEGTADSDGDRIPDYLDDQVVENILPVSSGGSLLQSEPGSALRLGLTAFGNDLGGARIELQPADSELGLASETLPPAENSYEYPAGVFDFEIVELAPGAVGLVVIPQDVPIAEGAEYRKYSPTFGWGAFIESQNDRVSSAPGGQSCPAPGDNAYTPGLTEGDLCVQLSIEDGGFNDADNLINGVILDPGGVAVLLSQGVGAETDAEPDGAEMNVDSEGSEETDPDPATVVTDTGAGALVEPQEPTVDVAAPSLVTEEEIPASSPTTDFVDSVDSVPEAALPEVAVVRPISGGKLTYLTIFGLILMVVIRILASPSKKSCVGV